MAKTDHRGRGDFQWMLRIVSGAVLNTAHAHPGWPPNRAFARSAAKRCVGTMVAHMPELLAGQAPKTMKVVVVRKVRSRRRTPPQAGSITDLCRMIGERIAPAAKDGDAEMEAALRQALEALAPLSRREKGRPPSADAPSPLASRLIDVELFRRLEVAGRSLRAGLGQFDLGPAIDWQESVRTPADADVFAREAIFVICNSGMRHATARAVFDRVKARLDQGGSARDVFGHPGKAAAIDQIWRERAALFEGWLACVDDVARLETLARLPYVGAITKFHLAKNFGLDVAKPDVHLVRLAEATGETVSAMCARLAAATGYRRATVDLVLWFACARGVIDSRATVPFAAFR